MEKLSGKLEITRLSGLGEISPNEFKVYWREYSLGACYDKKRTDHCGDVEVHMGKNTPDRQQFIIENLRVEKG